MFARKKKKGKTIILVYAIRKSERRRKWKCYEVYYMSCKRTFFSIASRWYHYMIKFNMWGKFCIDTQHKYSLLSSIDRSWLVYRQVRTHTPYSSLAPQYGMAYFKCVIGNKYLVFYRKKDTYNALGWRMGTYGVRTHIIRHELMIQQTAVPTATCLFYFDCYNNVSSIIVRIVELTR